MEMFKSSHELKNLIPFLEVYYLVTKLVAQKAVQNREFFEDFEKVNQLDVFFAARYFKPIENFILNEEKVSPWENYLKYSENSSSFAFVQMLLGINAHINGDLPIVLYNLSYNNRQDFLRINTILLEVLPDIVNYLVIHNRDIFAVGGLFMRNFFLEEFKKTIVKWRNDAWVVFETMKNSQNPDAIEKAVLEQTEEIAQEIIRIFHELVHFVQIKEDLVTLNHLGIKVDHFKTLSLNNLKA